MDSWLITREAYDLIAARSITGEFTSGALEETGDPNRIWVELDNDVITYLDGEAQVIPSDILPGGFTTETLSDVIIRLLSTKQ